GLQSIEQHLTLPRPLVPAREVALQLLLRRGDRIFQLGAPLSQRRAQGIGAAVARGAQLGELFLHLEYGLRERGRHALVVLSQLFAVQLEPVAAAAYWIAQRAIGARQKRRAVEARPSHRRRRRR